MARQSAVKGASRPKPRTVKVALPDETLVGERQDAVVGVGPAVELEKPVEQLAGWFTAELQKAKWKQLLNSENEQVVLRAMTYLCDRLYDKGQGGAAGKDSAVLELVVRHIGQSGKAE
ncbi:MAG TPA: hypothetical protein VGN16_15220 [Acidobacteriaceae bacterium]|jgi:hypothetical protein